MKKILTLLILIPLILISCGGKTKEEKGASTPQIKAYPLYVENYQFKKDGYTFLARGINVAGDWKYKNAPAIYPYLGNVTEGTFRWLREDLGYNFVRMLAIWAAIEPEPNKFNEDYIKEYAKRVSWAEENHMYVFIDMHQDAYSEAFYKYGGDGAPTWTCPSKYYQDQPDMPRWELGYLTPGVLACVKRFWSNEDNLWWHYGESVKRILQPFAKSKTVVGLEIMNEPFWGPFGPDTFERKYLYRFYLYIGKIIQQIAPQKIIFFEPAASKNLGYPSELPPIPFPQLAYAPHFYLTTFYLGRTYPGDMTGMLQESMETRIGEAKAQNAVPIIGEFGAWMDRESTIKYLKDFFNAAETVKINLTQWELTDTEYRFQNSDYWGEWIKVVIRAFPEMWQGNLVKYSYDPYKLILSITWEAKNKDDMIVTLPHYIFKKQCSVNSAPDAIKWEWINKYQIRITAEKSDTFNIKVNAETTQH